jgi:hypothetical protein
MTSKNMDTIIKTIQRMNVLEDPSHSRECEDDLLNKRLIAETLIRTPVFVREKVLEEVTFILMHGAYGFTAHLLFSDLKNKNQLKRRLADDLVRVTIAVPFILLNFAIMKEMDEEDKKSIVAHEAAHFILGHHETGGGSEKEREADDLIEKWGFKRAYPNKLD